MSELSSLAMSGSRNKIAPMARITAMGAFMFLF